MFILYINNEINAGVKRGEKRGIVVPKGIKARDNYFVMVVR